MKCKLVSGLLLLIAAFAVPLTAHAQEIDILGYGVSIPDGVTMPGLADHTDFGGTAVGTGAVVRTFTIQNTGTAPLNMTGTPKVTVSGAHAVDFTVTQQPDSPVAAGDSTTFEVTFAPGAAWQRTATLSISNDDPDENPYNFTIQGTGAGTLVASYATGSEVPLTTIAFAATGSTVNFSLNHAPATGTELMVVRNTGLPFIAGTFDNLAQGQSVPLSFGSITYDFVANYYGGNGNDLVLVWAHNRAFAWGSNSGGQLGDNSSIGERLPVPVEASGVLAGKTVVQVAAGYTHSLALCSDGTVAAWGYNSFGQLGDNTTTQRNLPVAINTDAGVSALFGKTVVAIAAGGSHSLALCSDGTVAAWGNNSYGKLGDDTTTQRLVPVAVNTSSGSGLLGKTVVAISAAQQHSLALCADGTVVSWGYNYQGQLGDNSVIQRPVPVAVTMASGSALFGKTVVAIAAGGFHSLALCSDGTVAAWGDNSSGQLGDNTVIQRNLPVAVNTVSGVSALSGESVTGIAAGYIHSMALCSDGTLATWGRNTEGQLGDNTTTPRKLPVVVNTAAGVSALFGKTVVAVAAGYYHSLALCSDGTATAWGINTSGQLGDNTGVNRPVPVAVDKSLFAEGENFTRILSESCAYHSLAMVAKAYLPEIDITGNGVSIPDGATTPCLADHTNFGGAVVSSGTVVRTFTIRNTGLLPLSLTGTPKVAVSGTHVADFSVTQQPVSPVPAGGSTTFQVAFAPGAAGLHTAAFTVASDAPGASAYDFAIQGNSAVSLAAIYTTGSEVPLTTNGFTATGSTVTFTLNHTPTTGKELMVVRNTGLGFIAGTFDNLAQGQAVPLSFGGITYDFVANYYGGSGNDLVLVRAHNRAFAWGANGVGQVGDNSTTQRQVPALVETLGLLASKTVTAVATGATHCLALCSDGTVAAWGGNTYGQLGDNTTTAAFAPVAVNSDPGVSALYGKTVVAVAACSNHSLALCSDGTVAAWGSNEDGQLGDGTAIQRNVPVAVHSLSRFSALYGRTVVAIAVGRAHNLARCSDGTVVGWGDNDSGQLGDNTTTRRGLPVVVNAASGVSALFGKTVVSIAAGGYHSLALCSDGTVAAWGYNSYGQLGDSTVTQRLVPVAVNTASGVSALFGKTVVQVAVGYTHSLALCSDGTAAAWGYNISGQLGDNTTTQRNVPVAVNTASGVSALFGKTVVQVAAGYTHSLALCSDGTVAAWGRNISGQLGDNTTTQRNVPVAVNTATGVSALYGKKVTAIAAGENHSLTLADGYSPEIHVTGNGESIPDGATLPGLANHTDFGSTTVGGGSIVRTFTIRNTGELPLNLTGTAKVAVSGAHAADFTVTRQPTSPVAAGGSTTFEVTFVPGAAWLRKATLTIASDDPNKISHDFAIQGNRIGALAASYTTGSEVLLVTSGFIATGSTVSFTLKHAPATGRELTVVRNTGAGFISGTFDNLAQGQSVQLSFGGITYDFVANYYGGSGNDLVLVWANNRAFAWGDKGTGQLGDSSGTQRQVPLPVEDSGVLAGKTVITVATGSTHSLALCSDGTVAAWGDNTRGQLGDNTWTSAFVPVGVNAASGVSALFGKTVVAIAAGEQHSLALCSDGTVAAWGKNTDGQLGDTTSTTRPVPVAVNTAAGVSALFGKSVVAIAAGKSHSLALCLDGTVSAWGYNSGSYAPLAVNTASGLSALFGKTVVSIAAGGLHSLALCSDGTVAAWGDNTSGQLGDSTTTRRGLPVAVNAASGVSTLFGKTVTAIAAGDSHSLALCSDGTVAAWGSNAFGQLGDNTTTQRNVPVAVNTASGVSALYGKSVAAIAVGGSHGMALCTDRTVASWGGNTSGQLGDNSLTQRLTPVAVNTASGVSALHGKTVTAIAAGASHSLALAASYAPEIRVTGNGKPIPDGTALPSLADYTDFGSTAMGGATVVRTFTILNTGNLPLNLTGTPKVAVGGIHAADFTVTRQPDSQVAAGGTTTFDVTFSPGAAWLRSATLNITNDDPDENPYNFTIQGTGAGTLVASYTTGSEVPMITTGLTATGSTVNFSLNHAPATGTELALVRNTGLGFINGTFDNLVQGQSVALSFGGITYEFVANYSGGNGNDLVLVWAHNRAFAWGSNASGQLGDNTTTQRLAPTQVMNSGVLADKTVTSVAAGASHSLALCSDGTVAAWGLNDYGQLGDKTTTRRLVPVVVNADSGVSALFGRTVVAIAAGEKHSLALCSDGTVAAWGHNYSGQLGDNTGGYRRVPVVVRTASGSALFGKIVVAIAAGGLHCLALCSDGTAAAWGDNTYGQLGDNTVIQRNLPAAVNMASGSLLFGKSVSMIAAGRYHCLALCTDGTAAAWGYNSTGQLGDNTVLQRNVPVAVNTASGVSALFGKTVTGIAAGSTHSLALCSDGAVAAWGANTNGQLGDNATTQRNVPVTVNTASGVSALFGKTVTGIAAGSTHSLVLCSDGAVAAWGANTNGQLGDNATTQRNVPVLVSASSLSDGERFTRILSGSYANHSLALAAAPYIPEIDITGNGVSIPNGVTSPGLADHTDFGSTAVSRGSVVRAFTIRNSGLLALNLTGLPKVAVSGTHAADFTVTQQPGSTLTADGSATFEITFAPGAAWLRTATITIASDDRDESLYSFAIQGTGTGMLDASYDTSSEVPLTTSDLTATGSTVSFSLNHAPATGAELIVVRKTGFGFISGTFDNLAQGQRVSLPFGGVTYHFVANYFGGSGNDLVLVWAHNRAFAWGSNASGQLGDNTTTQQLAPTQVMNSGVLADKTVTSIAAGASHSLALCSDGTVAAWGLNTNGQLGDNTTTQRTVPVVVNTSSGVSALFGKTVLAISAGASHSLALCSDGTVAAWGYNNYGQLGDNTTSSRNAPKAVNLEAGVSALSGKTVVAVAAGSSHSLALCSDGTVAAWGYNNHGQLGDNSVIQRRIPVAVDRISGVSALFGKKVVGIAAGEFHSLALCSEGTVVAWGYNASGQLGDNTTLEQLVPVAVNTASGVSALFNKTVTAIETGRTHSLALCSDGTVAAWGLNTSGQLGDNTTTQRNVPVVVNRTSGVSVLFGRTATAIRAGGSHSLALCMDGTATAWGYNASGQLGDTTTTQRLVPVSVNTAPFVSSERIIQVASGPSASHTLGLAAQAPAPQVRITGNGASIPDGASTPDLANHTDFGSVAIGTGTVVRTFSIRNTGNLPLNLTGTPKVAVSGAHAADFTVTQQPASPIVADDSTTFQITFVPGAAWLRTAITAGAWSHNLVLCSDGTLASWGNNGNAQLGIASTIPQSNVPVAVTTGEVPAGKNLTKIVAGYFHSMVLEAAPYVPEIHITATGGDIPDGGMQDFGSLPVGTDTSQVFTITNSGNAGLTGLGIAIGGTDAALFSITESPVTPVSGPGGATTFAVRFAPTSAGPKTAALHIVNNDPDENPYDITLTGTGLATSVQLWRQTHFGSMDNTGDGADHNDFDRDGIPNLLEFAFGLDPKQNSAGMLPQPQQTGSNLIISFPQPNDVSGVTYGAEWSETLQADSWTAVTDSVNGLQHTFSVPTGTKAKLFMRLKVVNLSGDGTQ